VCWENTSINRLRERTEAAIRSISVGTSQRVWTPSSGRHRPYDGRSLSCTAWWWKKAFSKCFIFS
jgi:hypothetical protein